MLKRFAKCPLCEQRLEVIDPKPGERFKPFLAVHRIPKRSSRRAIFWARCGGSAMLVQPAGPAEAPA